jgi:hypothetical protein
MLKWNGAALDETDEAILCTRKQDDEFCKMLRIAIEKGAESCPIGVSTEPGTKKPVVGYPNKMRPAIF